MIENFGIGIDISSIEKFKNKPFKENKNFYKKIFSGNEINFCLKSANCYEKFAAKFAIKEATIKSIHQKLFFSDIETLHSNSKPIIKILNSNNNYRFLVSVSHDNGIAVAVVISEKIK
ncbi:MAG: 4-phosphopantetheinyl transferase [Chloroflexi bacterium]|nr:4-phosphopantetheinyl transferase [Chloroflexota bacterium]|tara:strand:+ start:2977 stop:3330 length:354 start_codon:yes stop_codon:yes gene_type:complete